MKRLEAGVFLLLKNENILTTLDNPVLDCHSTKANKRKL